MVSDELSVVVVSVPDVVASLGLPISVVDSGTLVVNVVEVSDGVMTNVCLSRVSVGADCVVTGVVNTVVSGAAPLAGHLHHGVHQGGDERRPDTAGGEGGRRRPIQALLPGSLSGATCRRS